MGDRPTRTFLGWDGPLLERAAEWLTRELGHDLGDVLVALPGGRAGRLLQEKLARLQPPSWNPPRVLTQGALTDELVRLEVDVADRIVRTLVWERALHAVDERALARLLARTPAGDDTGAWSRLAETLRTLHGELAPEGRDFAGVAKHLRERGRVGESRRWETLARVQDAYRAELAALGLADPHEARLAAIEERRVACDARIVLVGVADMNHLLRRALEELPKKVTALVFAPESEADAFDAWGCVDVAAWKDRDVPLALEDWLVADKPGDQARVALERLAATADGEPCDSVRIGIADEEVAPYVERRLAEQGLHPRNAAGVAIERTRPYRLLGVVAAYVRSRSWRDWAALVRHPDLEAHLGELDAAAVCDAYHDRFLPERIEPGPELGGDMGAIAERAAGLLGGLLARDEAPLARWAEEARALLVRVYGERELGTEREAERADAGALVALGEHLGVLGELGGAPAEAPWRCADALGLVLRESRSAFLPPAPAPEGAPVVELLGWLELTLDDAPHLVVTGFCDGRVPEALGGDPFLPNTLRTELALFDADARQARDVHELTVLCNSREVAFVSGRRSAAGEPLAPSRLAFHRPVAEVPERVERWLSVTETRTSEPQGAAGRDWSRPLRAVIEPPRRISVTGFKRYLASPYQFYLSDVLRLETLDDEARELDGAKFGDLAHAVLERFGKSAARDALDVRTVDAALQGALRELAQERYGRKPLPAVALQVEQLAYRLRIFAERQVEWARQGWRIAHVEWKPEHAELRVDGEAIELRGRIDRIDHNARTGQWAILDYKTPDKARKPEAEHYAVNAKRWKDLQLPLYCRLVEELGIEEQPQLGYVNLGYDEASIHFALVRGWDEERLGEAFEQANTVVRALRAGAFAEPGRGPAYDPITQALLGVGLMESGDDDEDEEAET